MKANQKGFGAIEALLIVVLVGIIGFAGWYVYDSNKKTNQTYDKSAASVQNTYNDTTSSNTELNNSNASKLVTEFYSNYVKTVKAEAQKKLVTDSGTQSLLDYFNSNQNGVDPIVCAQSIPDSFEVTDPKTENGTATLVVEEMFGDETKELKITVVKKGELKIDTITCPDPLPTGDPGGP